MSTRYLPGIYLFSGEWTEHPELGPAFIEFYCQVPIARAPFPLAPEFISQAAPYGAPIIFFIAAMCLSM
jgi:hypothetical protein